MSGGVITDILQLRYFKKIAELENVSKASQELMVAQPALSKTIKQLETELDVQLFDRAGKRIYLNDNGRILLKHTDCILSHLKDAVAEINDYNERVSGSITISMQAATRMLPQILLGFKQLYPAAKIIVKKLDDDTPSCENCDLHIFSSRLPVENSNTYTLLKEDCLLGMSPNHRLANAAHIDMIDLKDEDFIIIQNRKSLSDTTNEFCREAGFLPNVVLECDHQSAIFTLIENNIGIAFIPSKTWLTNSNHNLVFHAIRNKLCSRYINVSWGENTYHSKLACLFREYLISFFQEL